MYHKSLTQCSHSESDTPWSITRASVGECTEPIVCGWCQSPDYVSFSGVVWNGYGSLLPSTGHRQLLDEQLVATDDSTP